MFIALLVLFVIAASLGGWLLSYVLMNKNTPKGIALLHGGVAVAAVILLVMYCLYHPEAWLSLVIFAIAAAGGLFLFTMDLLGKGIPKIFAMGHGILAVSGLLVLIYLTVKI